jgi:mannose-6-phosphate isomerase
MLSDRSGDPSVVAEGPLSGRTLRSLIEEHREALLGTAVFHAPETPFPLLVKLLEVRDWLSVQVHPASGKEAKTEAWFVLEAAAEAEILLGTETGAWDPARLPRGLKRHRVKSGDAVLVPAGTVHAIGPGLRLAEVQENSDTTYRLYDWGREGRALQMEAALRTLAAAPARPLPSPAPLTGKTPLSCGAFTLSRLDLDGREGHATTPERFGILGVAEGACRLSWDSGRAEAPVGSWWLLPAALGAFTLEGRATLLEVVP